MQLYLQPSKAEAAHEIKLMCFRTAKIMIQFLKVSCLSNSNKLNILLFVQLICIKLMMTRIYRGFYWLGWKTMQKFVISKFEYTWQIIVKLLIAFVNVLAVRVSKTRTNYFAKSEMAGHRSFKNPPNLCFCFRAFCFVF